MENTRSTAAEEAGTAKYFLANLAKDGNILSYVFQKLRVQENLFSETVLIYSSIILSTSSVSLSIVTTLWHI